MRKLYLDWGRAPVILYMSNDGFARAAFMKADPFGAWRPVNPLQVREEAKPLSRRDWKVQFGDQVGGTLPKAKDFDVDKIYKDDDPWYPVDFVPEDDPQEQMVKAEEDIDIPTEGEILPSSERLQWEEDEIEVEYE